MRINVTFKKNEREVRLFDVVNQKMDKSAFVKECIEFYLDNYEKEFKVVENNKSKNEVPEINWDNMF